MNNFYVDELPDCCGNCSLCCKDDLGFWCQATILIYIDERFVAEKRLKSCPLKLITDRLAEERKKVVQEVKQKLCRVEDTLINLGSGKEDALSYFVDILDQIERGE